MKFGIESLIGDTLSTAKDSGLLLLANEISQHGGSQPASRPDPQSTPATVTAPVPGTTGKGMDKKTMIYVGAGVAATIVVLALILKKK